MMIIPIGTKATLALKPKMTIGLIAVNAIVALFTLPLAHHSEKRYLEIQRERFARETRLYIAEHRRGDSGIGYVDEYVEEAIEKIPTARDYYELELYITEAMATAGFDPADLEPFETELHARTEEHYSDSFDGSYEHFVEWRRLTAKEDKVLSGDVTHVLGLVPSRMSRVYTFFTHLFIHGGIMHLLGNMLFLWVVGCLLEDSWGRLPFLVFYLAGGAVAGLAHCLQNTASPIPLIGASGAIAATMGAFTIRHFWTRIKFFYFFLFFRPYWGTFHLPAFVFLPFWFIEQVVLKYVSSFVGGSEVAYFAHIAGYIVGIMTALAIRASDFEKRYLTPRVHLEQVEAGVRKDHRFDRACDLLGGGKIDQAKTLFGDIIKARPHDYDTLRDIAMMYKEKGLTEDYRSLTERVLKGYLLRSRYDEAGEMALEIVQGPGRVGINPQYLLRLGKWFADKGDFGSAHDLYRAVINSGSSPEVSAKASIALAKLLYGTMNNARDALQLLEHARTLPLDAEWAEQIAALESAITAESMSPVEV